MLEAARLGLVELGILDRSAPLPPFWARMSGNLVVLVHPDARKSYLVKVGIRTSLDNEHQGLATAYDAMPDHVPQPLGLLTARNVQLLVTRGLRHAPLFPFRNGRDERMFADGIGAFFAVTAKAFRRDGPGHSQRELRDALANASTLLDWPDCDRYRERVLPIVGALGRTLQHGDFTINNIARSGRRLVFFDWEDFGHVDLPGFDLAILMLSLHEFHVTALKRALASRSAEAAIMDQGCASLGLEPSQFMALFPAYLALFIRLKTALGYGPEGPRRAAAALADWIGAPPALSPPAQAARAVETKKTAQGVVRRSIAIAFAETYVMVAIQFLTSIIIARLLTPDEIGVFSVAVVAVSIAHTVREFGIVSYLIKEETLTDEKIRAASALSFATSWTLGVIIFASSFWLASFYRDPRLLHLLWILALNFILIPFGSVVFAILRREMRMGAVFILRTISVLCGAAAAITFAWLGFGPMSLALSLSVNLVAMVTLVQFYRPSDMPRMPSFRGAMSIVNFSAFSLTSSLATDVAKAAPDVVLGRVQSMTSVGLFGRAMGLVDMFSNLIENSIWSVSLPYFSRLKREGGNVGAALARTQAYISGLAWPFYAVLALSARPVILTLYGPQWEGSVAPAEILCAFGAIVATTSFASTAMTAADMIGPATRMNVKISLVRILVTIAAAPFGLLPLAVALIGAAVIEFAIVLSATHRTLGVAPSELAPSYARSAVLAAICALPLVGLSQIGALSDIGLLGLAAVAVLSVVVWTAGLYLTRHPLREEIGLLISHLLKRPTWRK